MAEADSAPSPASGGTPAVVLGTVAAPGVQTTFLRDDDIIAAFDVTVPVTQAFSDIAAVGEAVVAARRDHRHGMMAAPSAGAVTRVGGNTTEATTTSTSAVNLLSVAGVSIAAVEPFEACAVLRKTTGAANNASVGFTLNTTVVIAPAVWVGSSNGVQQGMCDFLNASRVTSYLRSGVVIAEADNTTVTLIRQLTADSPAVALTTLVLTGLVGDALITMGADQLEVYKFAVS